MTVPDVSSSETPAQRAVPRRRVAVSCRHNLRQSFIRGVNALCQFVGIEPANGVLHHDELWLKLARLGLGQDERSERIGRNDVGCHASLFEFNAVMETPRRTGASISERK